MQYTLSQLTLHLTHPAPIRLPHGTVVTVALDASARMGATPIALARQTIRCVGTLPPSLVLQYDPRAVDPERALSVQVRVECEGDVLLLNDGHAPVAWPGIDRPDDVALEGLRLEPVTIALIAVGTGADEEIHEDQLAQGAHGGNLINALQSSYVTEGIHGGNLIDDLQDGHVTEGIHGGNLIDALQGGHVTEGIHGGNLMDDTQGGYVTEGIHGGNLIDAPQDGHVTEGIHGGNLIDDTQGAQVTEGIHGGNRMQERST
ncbi:YbaY family lipoprotein [Pseudomonas entomophila]|uniref:YbaY family lipoprotein n=1 Tax=Pseudomonas entomophila TaxID=312306 RepID=UPI003EB86943